MQRFLPGLVIAILLSGCGTSPVSSETTRGVVLEYLGGDVGTAGPFGKGGKKELDVLSAADRQKAESLIDHGAVVFLVFGRTVGQTSTEPGVSRVILVHSNQIVGDFPAQPKPAAPTQPNP